MSVSEDKQFTSHSAQKVSVIVEASSTDLESSHTTIMDTLHSLKRQKYPQDLIEVIVCQSGWDSEKMRAVNEMFPGVRVLTNSDGGYYRLKNLGIEDSTGDVLAMADADCVYSPDWISSIVDTLQGSADASVGLTVYPGKNLLRRLCAFYGFYHIMLRKGNRTRRFLSSNVAFKSHIVKGTGYDGRFERSGGCVQLADRLIRSGVRMEFDPRQFAVHNFYGFRTHVWERAIRNGYDMFHTRRLDPKMPFAGVTRLHILAPPVLYWILVLSDVFNIFQNRVLLNVRWYELPIYLLFSVSIRLLELIGMYWTLFHEGSIGKYVRR